MKRNVLLIALLAALSVPAHADDFFNPFNPAAAEETRTVYGNFRTFWANDAVPISQQNKNWTDFKPRGGTNAALQSSSYELGVQWQGYRFGYFERLESTTLANRDFIDDLYARQSGAGLTPGRTYALNYKVRGFNADGLRLAKSFVYDVAPRWQFGWGGAASLLRGLSVQKEDISATASTVAGTTVTNWLRAYGGPNKIGYDNTVALVPGAPIYTLPGSPSGLGYSFDFGIGLVHESGLRFEWVAKDAIARIKWNDIPETLVPAGSNFDAVTGLPTAIVLGGYQGKRVTFTEALAVKHSLSMTVPTRMANIELSDTIYRGLNMPLVGLSKRIDQDWGTRLDYDVRFSTVGVGLAYRWLYLSARTDSLNFNKARAYGASIGARLEF